MYCPNTDINAQNFDSPPVANTGLTVQLSNTADTLIWDSAVNNPLGPFAQIALDPNFDASSLSEASFWIKIIDDPVLGVYPQLWGRMFSADGDFARPVNSLPSNTDSSIIPIGEVSIPASSTSGVTFYQYISGNLTNRYAAIGPIDSPLGPVNIQRGYWKSGLSGQVFYKGDIIVDDSAELFNGIRQTPPSGYFTYGVPDIFRSGQSGFGDN